METRRRRLRFMSDDEEEDRRTSPRKRKRDRYFEGEDDDDYDDDDDDDEEEEEDVEDVEKEEDMEDNEQPGPSTQNTHIWRTQEGLLTVICGNKSGTLDVEKLRMSEECIMWQGRWFSPPAFEEFGGKGSNKKWKASIFFENKPLQFWIEQGHLATKGYKRRRAESMKQKKTLSSTHTSESSSEESEIQPAEGTDEDDVKDEDWHPCSEELALETEQERAGDENGKGVIDSGDDKNKEEDDKMEKGEMENEDMSVADNDNSVFEEGKWIISTPDKHILRREVKVMIRRLSEFQTRSAYQSSCTEDPPEENWYQPLGEDAQSEEGREHNGSAIDDRSDHSYPSQMSDSPITGGESEEREETGHHGEMEIERKRRKTAPEMQRHVEMSRCEASGHLFASGNITDATLPPTQRAIKEEITDEMCTDPPLKSPMMMVECKHENTGATTSGHEAGESQVMKQETEVPQMSQASDIPQFSNMVEAPSSAPSTSRDLDTMGLDELKREKLKMQIKVLRLQEEYYTEKIQKHGSLVVKMMVARGQDSHSGITEGV